MGSCVDMEPLEIMLLVALGVGAIWGLVVLTRQGHPENPRDRDQPERLGPTGEQYPTGSRPAGPGAERMAPEPARDADEDDR